MAALLPATVAGLLVGLVAADGGWGGPALAVNGGGLAVALSIGFLAGGRGVGRLALPAVAVAAGVVVGTIRGGPPAVPDLQLPPNRPVALVGTVDGDPVPRQEVLQVVLVDLAMTDGEPLPAGTRLQLGLPRTVPLTSGDRLMATVEIRDPTTINADYRMRLVRQGIAGLGETHVARVIGHAPGGPLDAVGALRRALLDGLVRVVPEPEASLGAGILLGVRSGIDPALNADFATAGLSHIVAVSGWNVAIVVGLVLATTSRMSRRGAGGWLQAGLSIGAIGLYVVLTGGTASVVRAAIMATALIVGRLRGSPAHAGGALLLAVGLMALASPSVLWDVGFQLSALATAGLICFAGPMERRFHRWPGWIGQPVGLTIAAQVATLPVLLATFGRLSLIGPLANVAAVPLVPAAMASSAVAALVGAVPGLGHLPGLAWLSGGLAWMSLAALAAAGHLAAAVPGAALPVEAGPSLALAWYPLLAVGAWRANRRARPGSAEGDLLADLPEAGLVVGPVRWLGAVVRSRRALAAPLLALLVVGASAAPDGRLHLWALDIGQGDAILVETPSGATMLIDGGPDPERTLRQLGRALPWYDHRIDLLVLSHPHQDHLAGLFEVLRRFDVGQVLVGGWSVETDAERNFLAAAASEPHVTVSSARAGMRLRLDRATSVEVLFPRSTDASAPPLAGDVNNGSIVLHLRYGGFDALLTGDAEAPVEQLLLGRGLLGQVEVLKVAHHGSRSGTTPPFLAVLQPRVALISCGTDNEYGHPHGETLDALAAVDGLTLFRTDVDGSVEIISDGQTLWVHDGDTSAGPWPVAPVDWPGPLAGRIGR